MIIEKSPFYKSNVLVNTDNKKQLGITKMIKITKRNDKIIKIIKITKIQST